MVGAFFCCHNIGMDIMKLCDKLFEDKELQDIPIDIVFRVVKAVIDAISTGECFYENE